MLVLLGCSSRIGCLLRVILFRCFRLGFRLSMLLWWLGSCYSPRIFLLGGFVYFLYFFVY